MRWDLARIGLAAAAACAAAGCDRLAQAPQQAAPVPQAAEAAAFDPELIRVHAGESYSSFVAADGARYSPDALGIGAADRARLWRGMAASEQGQLFTGGGAEALVFRGCAEGGCGAGLSIVAVDTGNGSVFVAVRDVGGADVLASNDRVEALLRLNSPTRRWDDAAQGPATAQP